MIDVEKRARERGTERETKEIGVQEWKYVTGRGLKEGCEWIIVNLMWIVNRGSACAFIYLHGRHTDTEWDDCGANQPNGSHQLWCHDVPQPITRCLHH